jgi:hypothetical protein
VPLHCAAWSGNAELVALLLEKGTDMNVVDQVSGAIHNINEYLHMHLPCIYYYKVVHLITLVMSACGYGTLPRMAIRASTLRRSMGVRMLCLCFWIEEQISMHEDPMYYNVSFLVVSIALFLAFVQ